MPALLYFWLSLGNVSCGPSIHSFKVNAQTVTAADSIKVDWEVSGKPTLLIHEKAMGGGNGGGLLAGGPEKYLELTLVAQKNGKEARQFIQVIVLPPISVDTIFLTVGTLHGDTLIARGEKNVSRWGDHFQLGAVASASGRPMWVTHAGKTVLVNGSGSSSFQGVSNSGPWEFRTLLTETEKRDHTMAPSTLSLQTILLYNKQ
ncbi:MAG: hypothetical protein ABUM51_09930 [Bacteroidota bacterium]